MLYTVTTIGVVIPYLAGYLFELVVVAPLAVDAEEMPIWFPLQVRRAVSIARSPEMAANRTAGVRAVVVRLSAWPDLAARNGADPSRFPARAPGPTLAGPRRPSHGP